MSAQAIVPSANVFYEMDAKDEQQILAALEGQIVDELVYEVEGKKGLSYTGVNHISFKMGHIKVLPESMRIEYDQEEDEYTAYIIAVNEKYNLSAPGVAVQPRLEQIHVVDPATGKYAKDEKGAWVWTQRKDRFAKVKAMSKATRNAKRAVIPEAMMKKIFTSAEKKSIPVQVSLERYMKCGFGLCGSCAIGRYLVCVDGPVFNSEQLREVSVEFGVSRRDSAGRSIPV